MGQFIVFLIFVAFSIVSSIAKSAKEKREREAALERRRRANAGGIDRPAERPQRKKSVQSEIESFLNDVSDGRVGQKAEEEENERRERAAAKRRKQEAARRRQQQIAERKRQQQKAEQRRSSKPSDQKKPSRQKQPHETVAQSVEAHLGRRSGKAPNPAPAGRKGASAEIFAMLRDTQGVRNAIIVNEILNRPRSLRE